MDENNISKADVEILKNVNKVVGIQKKL